MQRLVDKSMSLISSRANRIETIGKLNRDELTSQGILLAKAEDQLDLASENVDQINMDLRDMIGWATRLRRNCFKCLHKQEPRKRIKVKTVESDYHLPLDQVDRLWCKRYHPQDKFFQQIEAQLDRLIDLAEALEMLIEKQEQQAQRMNVKGKELTDEMKKAANTMNQV